VEGGLLKMVNKQLRKISQNSGFIQFPALKHRLRTNQYLLNINKIRKSFFKISFLNLPTEVWKIGIMTSAVQMRYL